MVARFIGLALACALSLQCAQVPKESVELSATIGRDLAEVHRAHRELAEVLFARMRSDVNRFVDEVYAPYQVRTVMDRQWALAHSDSEAERNASILLAINAAFEPDAPAQLQANVLAGMGLMVSRIQADIESKREELLSPLNAQEAEVLGSIDRAYDQLHYANSIVTGHLSSVAKVHETQADLLAAIGVERDLRTQVAGKLASAADDIDKLVAGAEKAENRLDQAEENAKKLKRLVEGMLDEND